MTPLEKAKSLSPSSPQNESTASEVYLFRTEAIIKGQENIIFQIDYREENKVY